ncbi:MULTISPECIES: DUF6089 family protein [Flavobacterium]|uniref:type IX secretion system protein PorG n=1 Tax=Flavobacterium TaxID=237 RepID=UPI00086AE4E2|nr:MULTISPECIES: DUF6089 family protein [Flavobacterium]MBN9286235.1 hypothetical protein [Flavobacterium sp.]ODS85791.1 MAG: hypothetical protein ABS44_14595 [Chryseobacterium sp. SCN 40-13]OJV73853.1 MAG: hypothetical protein BGO42_09820 [Flavobacterium sp. 40-81]
MSRILIVFLLVFSATTSQAQINELGVFLGGTNYVGDVGPTSYIAPKDFGFGILYKWNRSTRHAYRISYTQGKISSSDADSKVSGRKDRGYSFENSVKELSLALEFNFFDFDLHNSGPLTTPYIATGVSFFRYDELYIINGRTRTDDSRNAMAIPIIAGIKTRLTDNLILGFEVGARYTFTDNLDGSNPRNDQYKKLQFGNLNSNDWYVFSGVTLTYTFGQNPCFCAE